MNIGKEPGRKVMSRANPENKRPKASTWRVHFSSKKKAGGEVTGKGGKESESKRKEGGIS